VTPVAQRDGSIALTRDGVPVLTLPAPFMTDARRSASSPYGFAWSPKVAQHATWDAATSTMSLSLSADAAWLSAAAHKQFSDWLDKLPGYKGETTLASGRADGIFTDASGQRIPIELKPASAKNLVRGFNQLAKYERDLGAPAGSGQVWFYDPDAIANGIQAWWRVL
jgi:hypothetical protein